jgi:DNA repair protein SbcD/Mre11
LNSPTSAKILAIGDVHLGIRCSGLPNNVSDWGAESRDFSPASALSAAVDLALKEKVDGVLFAGDVVDSTNARFEAIQSLEPNIERLLDAGIDVIAVAGNHDVEALPRIANIYSGFTLLGADGRWQSHVISRGEKPVAEILGWSFSERRINFSPVAQLLKEPLPRPEVNIPRIGLIHADLDASGGFYAPIKQSELNQTGLDGWLLGHIHKPSLTGGSDSPVGYPSGYLGSLVGLDPSEIGPRGPWLITILGGGDIKIEHHPIAPLRWEYLYINVEGINDPEDFPDRILSMAEAKYRELEASGFAPRALGLRAIIEGTSSIYEKIESYIEGRHGEQLSRTIGDGFVFINKIVNRMGLYIDLDDLAKGDHPAAIMAQRILLLEQNNDPAKDLVKKIQADLRGLATDPRWQPLNERRDAHDPIDDEALRLLLLEAGKSALSAMIGQGAQD